MNKWTIRAIKNVLNKRSKRGASDNSLIGWLKHLKKVHIDKGSHQVLDGFISAIKQAPLNIRKYKVVK